MNKYTWNGIDHSDKLNSVWKSKDPKNNNVYKIIMIKWICGMGIAITAENIETGERTCEQMFSRWKMWNQLLS